MPDHKYTLPTKNLKIEADMAFVNNVLKGENLNAKPEVRGLLLDIMYTLARDVLFEANRFTRMTHRSKVTLEDVRMEKSLGIPEVFKSTPSMPSAEKINQRQPPELRDVKGNIKQVVKENLKQVAKENLKKVAKEDRKQVVKENLKQVAKGNLKQAVKGNVKEVVKGNVKSSRSCKPSPAKIRRTNKKMYFNKQK